MTETADPRVAVVTGAGRRRGIGCAIARRLAADGFAVVVHERPAPRYDHELADGWRGAASVVDEITAAGGSAAAVTLDLVDPAAPQALLAAADELGSIAVLVNNAGVPGEANTYDAHETPDDVWDQTIAVNLTTIHRLSRAFVPALAASGADNRSIVHLSSTAGHRPLAHYGAYCASKGALERLTQQQAIEARPLRHTGQLHRTGIDVDGHDRRDPRPGGRTDPANGRGSAGDGDQADPSSAVRRAG